MNFDGLFDQPNEASEAWEKVRQLEAALAVAHEALVENAAVQVKPPDHPDRAAEELRLLRELEAADEAQEEAEDAHSDAYGEEEVVLADALAAARERRIDSLANLRRFREGDGQ